MTYSEDPRVKTDQLIECLRHRAERKKSGVRESTEETRFKEEEYENERGKN